MSGTRVLLADDHTLLLGAFEKLLASECEVVGTVSDGRELVEAAQRLKPDVIVLDIGMPLLNGLEAGRQIKQLLPATKLVFLTMNEDSDLAAEAFRAGASGYLLKRSATSELATAIREVIAGRCQNLKPLLARSIAVRSIEQCRLNRLAIERHKPHVVAAHHHKLDIFCGIQVVPP